MHRMVLCWRIGVLLIWYGVCGYVIICTSNFYRVETIGIIFVRVWSKGIDFVNLKVTDWCKNHAKARPNIDQIEGLRKYLAGEFISLKCHFMLLLICCESSKCPCPLRVSFFFCLFCLHYKINRFLYINNILNIW